MFEPRKALSTEQLRRLGVALTLDGQSPEDVANVLQVSERSIWRWLSAWRERGDQGLITQPGWGRPPKLSDAQAAQVLGWLEQSPGDFGFATERWTAPRVAVVIKQRFGVHMNHRYLNHWLARRGITPQVPERRPRERNEEVIAEWIAHRGQPSKKSDEAPCDPLFYG